MGKAYYISPIYPEIPLDEEDIYVITAEGDRYDLLAQEYYKDSSLWWIVAIANTTKKDGLNINTGVQIRIPVDPYSAKALFDEVNKNR